MILKIIYLFVVFILYTTIYIFIYLININFFSVDVLFYSSLFSGLIASIVFTILFYKFRIFYPFEKILIVICTILIGYIISLSVPTVIDRSLSIYLLEKIHQRGGTIYISDLNSIFTDEYVKEYKIIDMRLTEQINSGTITLSEDCVKLTKKGVAIANFTNYFRLNFMPEKRLILDRYSNDLIKPFQKKIYENNIIECK